MTLLAVADRTQETANNIGLSAAIVLLGAAAPGLQSFQMAGLDGEIVPYTIEHETSGQWEVGSGEYVAATHTLNRTTIYASSSGGMINFANGVVDVWVDLPAEKAVMLDADSNHLTLPAGLSIAGALDGVTTLLASGAATLQSTLTVTTSVTPAADNAAPLGTSSKRWSDLRVFTATLSGLLTLNAGATVASGQTLALAGATVSGAPTWSSNQAITLSTAAQPNITSVGTLTSLAMGGTITAFAITPATDNLYALGTGAKRWSDLQAMTATFGSAVTMSSTLTIGGLTYTFPGSQSANYFLQTNGSGVLSWVAEGTSISLAGLSDVTITSATNGQALIYNSGTSKWNNSFVSLLTGVGTVTVGTWAAGAVSPAVDNSSALGTASFRWSDLRVVTATFSGLATFSLGATIASGQTFTLTGATVAGAPTWSSNQAITLSTASQSNVTTMSALTTIGTLIAGAVPASLVTAGTFGTGNFVVAGTFTPSVDNSDTLGSASFRWSDFRSVLATFSGVVAHGGTATFTAANPFSVTNAQTLTVATTAQTVGAATLTLPNFASVSDTFAFITLAQTLSNKTLASPTLSGTVAGTPTISGVWTWSSNQPITLSTAAQPNVTSLGTLAANLLFVDATYDIGASGATRARNLFLSGNITAGGTLTSGLINEQTISAIASFTGTLATAGATTLDTGAAGSSFGGTLSIAGIASLAANLKFTGVVGSNRYVYTDETNTGTGKLLIQAGGGSATYGGSINFGAGTHASIPGWVQIGLGSSDAGRKFQVTSSGLGTGTVLFQVDSSGNTIPYGNLTPQADNTSTLGSASFRWSDFRAMTATFSTGVVVNGTFSQNSSAAAFVINATSGSPSIDFRKASTDTAFIFSTATDVLQFTDHLGAPMLTLTGPAASATALFSNALTVPGLVTFSSANNRQIMGLTSVGTGYAYMEWASTGADLIMAIDNSTGGAFFSGSPAYAANVGTNNATSLVLGSAAVARWQINSSGHFLAIADNTYDIGASGATRARNLFLSGNITAGGTLTSGLINGQTISAIASFTGTLATAGATTLDTGAAGSSFGGTLSIAGIASLAANLKFTGVVGSNRYVYTDETNTGTGKLLIQAGGGSATYGGSINFGAGTHASIPGWVQIGLGSSDAGRKFQVTSSGLGTGTVLFQVDSSGNTIPYGNLTPQADNTSTLGSASFRWSDFRAMTATFSTGVVVNGTFSQNSSAAAFVINATSGSPSIDFRKASTDTAFIFSTATDVLQFTDHLGAPMLTLTGPAASATALFSNALTVPGLVTFSSANNRQIMGLTSVGTGYAYMEWASTGADLIMAIDNSTGGAFFSGSPAYAANVGTNNATSLVLGSAAVARWQINSSGHFLAIADNTYDIGASGATRPRNVYVGMNGSFGGSVAIGSIDSRAMFAMNNQTTSAGADQFAQLITTGFNSSATSSGSMIRIGMTLAAAAFTMGTGYSIYIANPFLGTGSALTTNYGLWIDSQTSGGTNYAIYTNTGHIRLGDTVTMSAYGAGAATFDASGNITSVSDERHKADITPFTLGLSALRGIRPISHRYNELSGLETAHTYLGFSAQNVREHLPGAVFENAGGMLSLYDRGIMAATVNAVNELDARVSRLEARAA